jgi:ribosome-associated protein
MPELDEQLLEVVRESLEDRKARDIQVLDIADSSGFADYFVIATGTSDRHVGAIVDHVREETKHAGYPAANGVEGEATGDWLLLDLDSVVVHVMRAETRAFYNLEALWDETLQAREGAGESSAAE